MAGKDGIIYTLIVKGDGQSAKTRLSEQEWIKSVTAISHNGTTTLQVSVTDASMAEAQLLRLIQSDTGTTVTKFGRKKHSLEQV